METTAMLPTATMQSTTPVKTTTTTKLETPTYDGSNNANVNYNGANSSCDYGREHWRKYIHCD
jgi:hypothetical protein